jgi:hypothetical protein
VTTRFRVGVVVREEEAKEILAELSQERWMSAMGSDPNYRAVLKRLSRLQRGLPGLVSSYMEVFIG